MANTTVKKMLDKLGFRVDEDPEENSIFISWIDDIVQYIALRLYILDSDLVEAALSLTYNATTNPQIATLPDDFWGLNKCPWIDGQVTKLSPLTNDGRELSLATAGAPTYFKLRSGMLYLYPPTDATLTVKGWYAAKPAAITKSSSTIPWNGLFDLMIQEGLVELYKISNPTLDNIDKLQKNAFSYLSLQEFKKNIEKVVLRRGMGNPGTVIPPRIV